MTLSAAPLPVVPRFAVIAIWVVLAIAGDSFLKSYAQASITRNLVFGCLCYGATVPFALITYRYSTWSWTALLWSGMALLLSMAVATFVFAEPMTWRRIASAVLLLAAMGLAE